MGHKHQWTEYDARVLGLAVLQALVNVGRGHYGEVDLDLGGRWVKIDTLDRPAFVVVSEMRTPPGFGRGTQEG